MPAYLFCYYPDSMKKFIFFIPPALLTILFMESNADNASELGLPIGLIFYGAAASKANNLWHENLFSLYIQRFASTIISYFTFAALYTFLLFLIIQIWAQFVNTGNPSIQDQFITPSAVILLLIMLVRFWPLMVIPFMYSGKEISSGFGYHLWDGPGGYKFWNGEGLDKSWRLTQGTRALKQASLPVLGLGVTLIGAYLTLLGFTNQYYLIDTLLKLLFYFIALPYLFLFAYRRIEPLIVENHINEEPIDEQREQIIALDKILNNLSSSKDKQPEIKEQNFDPWIIFRVIGLFFDLLDFIFKLIKLLYYRYTKNQPPLQQVCTSSDIKLLKVLLMLRFDPNERDEKAYTSLMVATSRNSIESVTLLLKYGADMTLKIDQRSVLQMALNRTSLNIFKLLLNSKSNDKSWYINDDYLLDSARSYPQALDILLSAGMDPDTLYNYHTTLLFHAAGDGQLESIRILLAHGADPHIKDNQDRVAKNYAYDGDGKAAEHYKRCETLLVEAMNKT